MFYLFNDKEQIKKINSTLILLDKISYFKKDFIIALKSFAGDDLIGNDSGAEIKILFSGLKEIIQRNSERDNFLSNSSKNEKIIKNEIVNNSFGNIYQIVENLDDFSDIKYVDKLERAYNLLSKNLKTTKEQIKE